MLKKSTLEFLKKLKKNNNRDWFNANKGLYEDAKADFDTFAFELIQEIGQYDESVASLQPKDCTFRIYKDVRFSKDKTPYKTNFGAAIQEGGRKSGVAGYYFHVQPGEFFVAGGLYMPDPDKLLKIRMAIANNHKKFFEIIRAKEFKKNFKDLWNSDKLKTAPKGFDKEHPAVEYLKLKSFLAIGDLGETEVLGKGIIKKAAKIFRSMQPFNNFLNEAITSRL
jgi:uncharacterized protein (TIGR02453 family)